MNNLDGLDHIDQFQRRADPSPEQIRAECEKIQATWSPRERARRARHLEQSVAALASTQFLLDGDGLRFWPDD